MSTIVSILGCGWLGAPTARVLTENGYNVNGSTTSEERLLQLTELGISSYVINCTPQIQGQDLDQFFNANVLLLTIPFRRNLPDPKYYQHQIQSIIKRVEDSTIDFVIFTSSTAIYKQTDAIVEEESSIDVDNPRAVVLNEIENELRDNSNFKTTILRLSGLYGGERKIGSFLSGKKNLDRGNCPVNLVHLDDCVAIINQIIDQRIIDQTFNVVSDHHPLRKDLYSHMAKIQGVSPPEFNQVDDMPTKIVSNAKLKEVLKYSFIHPDPMQNDCS